MTSEVVTRRASVDDVDTLVADVATGFASYVAFAAPGWRPPEISGERERTAELIADDATWALLALVDGAPAQGYERARLFTPSLHARARRFYERRDWTVAGEEWNEFLDLELAEYRLELG
jgi:hypothetical protein